MKSSVICDWCGKEFERKQAQIKKHNYCCRACLGKANAERLRLHQIKKCDYCGREFEYRGRHAKRNEHFFCCKECSDAFKARPVTVLCDWCGKAITRKESAIYRFGIHNFCDRGCYQDFVNFEMAGAKNQRVCGKTLYRRLAGMKAGRELATEEYVHHLDGNHLNNDFDNLLVVSCSDHSKIHAAQKTRDNNGRFIK